MTTLKLYLIVATVFLVIDAIWIGVLMKGFYNLELGPLARREEGALSPRWSAGILVYLLIPFGLVLFVRPAMGIAATGGQAFGWGAVFGLIVYGVYDLTNRATLEHWSLRLTLVDMLWGATICGGAAVALRMAEGWLRSESI